MAYLLKTYNLNNLLCSRSELSNRILAIENFTQFITPKVVFEYNLQDMVLIRRTEKLSRTSFEYGGLSDKHKYQFIKLCNNFYNTGLIHGDLNRKNVFIHSNNIVISDWEPCLKQIIFDKPTIMGTVPYIDFNDAQDKNISLKTDLMCAFKIIHNPGLDFFKSTAWKEKLDKYLGSPVPFDICS